MSIALGYVTEVATDPVLWTLLGIVITAILGYAGVRYTATTGKKASEYSAILSAPDNISAGYDRLNDDLWRSFNDCKAENISLKADAVVKHSQYRASIAYIRRLLSLLTLHAPAVPLPEPPVELHDDVRVNGGGGQ